MALTNRFATVWNAFRASLKARQPALSINEPYNNGAISSIGHLGSVPHRPALRYFNDRSIVASIYNRMSIDAAGVDIRHVVLDDQDRYSKDADSELNYCLTIKPNLDQSPRAFRQDIVTTLFDKGVAVIVPVDTDVDPDTEADFDVHSMRVGEVVDWYPRHVRVSIYNDVKGLREEVLLRKEIVVIIENPFYQVMNEPLSTLQRLSRKLQLLDIVDEQSGSGKLDIIIQLPYAIKSEARKESAEKRRQEIEFQLRGSQYGIAYTDGTEKITQLNRPTENNLLKQVEILIDLLYTQLGITEEIMNGTAEEKAMLNYYSRTIEPVLDTIVQATQNALLSRDRIDKKERIQYFRNPFKLVPISALAEMADKFTRNEIFTSNEIRGFIGVKPFPDKKADQLVNSNMPQPTPAPVVEPPKLADSNVGNEPVKG